MRNCQGKVLGLKVFKRARSEAEEIVCMIDYIRKLQRRAQEEKV